MNGFTAGPWVTGRRHPGRVMAATGQGNVIAYCTAHPDDTDSPTREETANGRLIASAPELLGVLVEMMEFWDKGTPVRDGADVVLAARAVLAKAQGGGK